MAIENNPNIALGRPLRNAVRIACTSHAGWTAWREKYLQGDAASMSAHDIRTAATALGIDIENIAAQIGAPVTNAASPIGADIETLATVSADETKATKESGAFEGGDAMALVRDALLPAQDVMGAKLLALLEAAVLPLAQAATKGPRIITRETVRQIPVNAGGASSTRFVARKGEDTARNVFSIKVADAGAWRAVLDENLALYDGTALEGVPSVDPFHVWDAETLAYLCMAARFSDNGHALRNMSRMLVTGPAGTGKTSTLTQFAAHTGRPFVRIPFDRSTEAAELIGQPMPKAGGGVEFRAGALISAMQVPYNVILLDEPSFLRPGAAAVLQTILDTGVIYLKEDNNRRVEMAPGVIIAAADNTNLTGDETGRYADTQTQNIALQDRFAYIVKVDYLPENREADVITNRTGIPIEAARAMIVFATRTRKGADAGQLTAGCSLRRLIAWAAACKAGIPSASAFQTALMNATDATDRETIKGIEKACAQHALIDASVQGRPMPIPNTPAQNAAAASFGAPVTA